MRNYFGIRHGEYCEQELTDLGASNIGKIAKIINSRFSGTCKIFSSPVLRAKQSAEITAKVLGVEEIIFLDQLDERSKGIVNNARLYTAVAEAGKTAENVFLIGHLPQIRDFSAWLLAAGNFIGNDFSIFNGGFATGETQIRIENSNAVHLDYENKKWGIIDSRAYVEPKPVEPVKRQKVNLNLALDMLREEGRKPVLYVVHDTNDAIVHGEPRSAPGAIVLGMLPGQKTEFLEQLQTGNVPHLDARAYFGDTNRDIGKARGDIVDGKTKFKIIWTKSKLGSVAGYEDCSANVSGLRQGERYYDGSFKVNVCSGNWKNGEGAGGISTPRGKFRIAQTLEELGFEA